MYACPVPQRYCTRVKSRKNKLIRVRCSQLPSFSNMSDAAKQRAAAEELSPGDHVEWGAPVRGGKTRGEVVEIVNHDTDVKSNHFEASGDNPKVRVKSEKSGKEAVHKPTSVHKV